MGGPEGGRTPSGALSSGIPNAYPQKQKSKRCSLEAERLCYKLGQEVGRAVSGAEEQRAVTAIIPVTAGTPSCPDREERVSKFS